MILSIEGDEATGKTSLAYSAPLPIVGFALDMGIERAIYGGRYNDLFKGLSINIVPYDKEPEGKTWGDADITIFELPPPIQLDSTLVVGNVALWNYFIQLIAKALSDPQVMSIVVDTMTVARRVKASAHLETLQRAAFDQAGNRIPSANLREQLIQIEYGKVNDSIRDVYTTAAGVRKNLIAVHHLTDERQDVVGKDGKIEQALTGKRILEGLNGTHRFVDIALLTEKSGGEIKGKLLKDGYNLAQEGTVIENPTWDIVANLVSMGTGGRIELDRREKAVEVSQS